MPKARKRDSINIISSKGEVFITGNGFDVYYKYRPWLIKLNPKVFPVNVRKDHRKMIYMNGEKIGFGEVRYGCIPIRTYYQRNHGILGPLQNFLRRYFSIGCRDVDRGYIFINIKRHEFIVTKNITEGGNTRCVVYVAGTGEPVAGFIIDKMYDSIYPSVSDSSWMTSALIMAGYVADVTIYNSVAHLLNKKVEIIF